MKIIAGSGIVAFYTRHVDAKLPLEVWVSQMKELEIKDLHELKKIAGQLQVMGNKRVIFSLKKEKYIIVTTVSVRNQTIYIRWIGTQTDYNNTGALSI